MFSFLIVPALLIGAQAAADTGLPAYQTVECPFSVVQAQCARVMLPENHRSPRNTVSIPIVRLGDSDNNQTPAVVLGGGGPGGGLYLDDAASILAWDEFRRHILGEDGTLILMDQRGAGLSRPLLSCAEEESSVFLSLLELPRPVKEEARMWSDALQRCYTRLSNAGIEVEAYSTASTVEDIEAIRNLLEIESWHLIGFSYATRLALELLRRYPEGVESAVLDSPFPYDAHQHPPFYTFEAAISLIDANCGKQADCRRHGAVEENLVRALLLAEKTSLTVEQSYSGTNYRISLSPARLLEIIYNGMYFAEGTALLPFFSRQLAQGDLDNVNSEFFVYNYLDFNLDNTWASMLNLVINCRENRHPPPMARTRLQRHSYDYAQAYIEICDTLWPHAFRPPEIVHSAKPVLILNGSYDPTTPPQWGNALKQRLPQAQRIVVPASHTPSFHIPCLQKDIHAFFQTPTALINSHCAGEALTFY